MVTDTLSIEFVERFLLNAVVLVALLRFIYYRYSPNRDSLFGFFMFGHGVYMVSALMHNVDISMGFAFGLFAVLSMLRYRTEALSVRDMTYLFLVIVISLMSAVAPIDVAFIAVLNVVLLIIVAFTETALFAPRTTQKVIIYDNTANLLPENRELLLRDLSERTGRDVLDVEIGDYDFLRDSAKLRVTLDLNNNVTSHQDRTA